MSAAAAIPVSGAAPQAVSNSQPQESQRAESRTLSLAKKIAIIAIAVIAITAIVLTCIFAPVIPAIVITLATAAVAIYLAAYLLSTARPVVVVNDYPRSYVELDPVYVPSRPVVISRPVYVDPFYVEPRPLFSRHVHWMPSSVSPIRVAPPVRPTVPFTSFSSRITPPVRMTHSVPHPSSHVSVGSGRSHPGTRSAPLVGMSSLGGSRVAVGSGRR